MAESMVKIGVGTFVGLATMDIGQVVENLLDLALSVKNCPERCKELAEKVDALRSAIQELETTMLKYPQEFALKIKQHETNLKRFLDVVQDCSTLIEQYNSRTFLVKTFLAIKLEEDFISLDQRLERCKSYFQLDLQIKSVKFNIEQKSELEELKGELLAQRGEIRKLMMSNVTVDKEEPLSGVSCEESIVGDYILGGTFMEVDAPGEVDVILVNSDQGSKEAAILKLLTGSENILKLYGTWVMGTNEYLVMERPGKIMHTLDDYVRKLHAQPDIDDWRVRRMIALEIALGVGYAHSTGVLHKNLRSPNIFLTDDFHPKLFGFFQARIKAKRSDRKWIGLDGIRWAAPEMLSKVRPQYDEKCDIFSLGVILWEIITADYPYSDIDSVQRVLKERTANRRILEFPVADPSNLQHNTAFYKKFVLISQDCMSSQPRQRPEIGLVVDRLMKLEPEEMFTAS